MAWSSVANIRGPKGSSAYSYVAEEFLVPLPGQTETIEVEDASWIAIGQYVWLETEDAFGKDSVTLRVTAKDENEVTLLNPEGLGGAVILTGMLIPFAGSVAPPLYLLCDGASYPRDEYPELAAVLGSTYGGDATNFNVPDCRGVSLIGAGQGVGLTNRALGARGGAETHQLIVAEMPSHTHTQNAHSHNLVHGAANVGSGSLIGPGGGDTLWGSTNAVTATNQNTGGGGAHPNMSPFAVVNYLIKT